MSEIKIHLTPQPKYFPLKGGVKEHLYQIYNQMHASQQIELVSDPNVADILHVESAFPIPKTSKLKKILYTCHGGFVPEPLPVVLADLEYADKIVSVAQWIIDKYFPVYDYKTIVIPNGVTLSDFNDLPDSGLGTLDYILYAKEWDYYYEDFIYLAEQFPAWQFITTVHPENVPLPDNVKVLGLLNRDTMHSVLNDAHALLLSGSEVCPTMMLEAWACNTPVIAKNIDGNAELMNGVAEHGGVAYNDHQDLIMQTLELAANRSKYSSAGRVEVESNYQWVDLFKRYVEVYEGLLC